ncbi:MAG: PepSY domain-containing protein [Caldimonas sp.]
MNARPATSLRTPARTLLCALLLAAALPAWADVGRDEAAAVAQRVASGRVLSVDRAGPVWRVKILSGQGEVRIVVVDAASGRVVG